MKLYRSKFATSPARFALFHILVKIPCLGVRQKDKVLIMEPPCPSPNPRMISI